MQTLALFYLPVQSYCWPIFALGFLGFVNIKPEKQHQ